MFRQWLRRSAADLGNGACLIESPDAVPEGSGGRSQPDSPWRAQIEAVFRREHASILATLVRRCGGDFFQAEDLLAEAFARALEVWPRQGMPDRPAAWIQTVAQRRRIDQQRQRGSSEELSPDHSGASVFPSEPDEAFAGEDDRLRLIFTCCHPALDREARVALTLQALCGLTAQEIARAYLTRTTTMSQRLVRAKRKIRQAGVPYRVPTGEEVAPRLATVLRVLYLVFNEGYSATEGDDLLRHELAEEAIALTGQLCEWLPQEPDVRGLHALMRLQHARRWARTTPDGDWVGLAEQDRSLWDRAAVIAATGDLEEVLREAPPGPYTLQAAIAAVHAEAPRAEDTDWEQIVALYDRLLLVDPSPVVELNRLVAVAQHRGAEEALRQWDQRVDASALDGYLYLHATYGELLAQVGRSAEAREAFQKALYHAENRAERRLLLRKLAQLGPTEGG